MGFGGEIMGLKPPRFHLGIQWWCSHVAPEVVFEVKTEAEAKLHMYYFVLH
jgi:hypothetical protein